MEKPFRVGRTPEIQGIIVARGALEEQGAPVLENGD